MQTWRWKVPELTEHLSVGGIGSGFPASYSLTSTDLVSCIKRNNMDGRLTRNEFRKGQVLQRVSPQGGETPMSQRVYSGTSHTPRMTRNWYTWERHAKMTDTINAVLIARATAAAEAVIAQGAPAAGINTNIVAGGAGGPGWDGGAGVAGWAGGAGGSGGSGNAAAKPCSGIRAVQAGGASQGYRLEDIGMSRSWTELIIVRSWRTLRTALGASCPAQRAGKGLLPRRHLRLRQVREGARQEGVGGYRPGQGALRR